MENELIVSGKTVEAALKSALETLGKTADEVEYEVLEEPKKGLFGIGAVDAKLKVVVKSAAAPAASASEKITPKKSAPAVSSEGGETPASRAIDLIEKLIENMRLNASVEVVSEDDEGISLNVVGENLGVLIGRRGDVLDAVQYMANLSANLGKSGYYRVSLDAQGYRAKRAETIRAMARRVAEKALKYHRSFQLDPMSPYERRIAHDECQKIPGVSTHSIGEGAERRVVISPDKD